MTGQPPVDPTAGFLPVNDTLTGSGEGFLNFTCKPKSITPTGEIVAHKASIVFDLNDPIETNTWENKIDALPPTTTLDPLQDTFYTNVIPFDWIVSDDPGGCGVQHTQVFLSTDRIEFESNGLIDSLTSSLTLHWDTWYYFMVLSDDHVNNREEADIDSFYIIPQREIEFLTPDEDHYCIGDTLWVDVNMISVPDADLYISVDSGMVFTLLADDVAAWPYPLALDSNDIFNHIFLKARNDSADVERISDPFSVKYLPVIDAGLPAEGCDNEILFVEATGANEYSEPVFSIMVKHLFIMWYLKEITPHKWALPYILPMPVHFC